MVPCKPGPQTIQTCLEASWSIGQVSTTLGLREHGWSVAHRFPTPGPGVFFAPAWDPHQLPLLVRNALREKRTSAQERDSDWVPLTQSWPHPISPLLLLLSGASPGLTLLPKLKIKKKVILSSLSQMPLPPGSLPSPHSWAKPLFPHHVTLVAFLALSHLFQSYSHS